MSLANINYLSLIEGLAYLQTYIPKETDPFTQSFFNLSDDKIINSDIPIAKGVLHELTGEISLLLQNNRADMHFNKAKEYFDSADEMDVTASTYHDGQWAGGQGHLESILMACYGESFDSCEDYNRRIETKYLVYKLLQ